MNKQPLSAAFLNRLITSDAPAREDVRAMDDTRSQEQDLAIYAQWFIEAVINQNYAIESINTGKFNNESANPNAQTPNAQTSVAFHFPLGLSPHQPALSSKRFSARLWHDAEESRLYLTNLELLDEYFIVEMHLEIKHRYWFFRQPKTTVTIFYQDEARQHHHYHCVYGWQVDAIALPFIKLLKAISKLPGQPGAGAQRIFQ